MLNIQINKLGDILAWAGIGIIMVALCLPDATPKLVLVILGVPTTLLGIFLITRGDKDAKSQKH